MQFIERIFVFFVRHKYRPNVNYLRHVAYDKINLFTLVQLLFTSLLLIMRFVQPLYGLVPLSVSEKLVLFNFSSIYVSVT